MHIISIYNKTPRKLFCDNQDGQGNLELWTVNMHWDWEKLVSMDMVLDFGWTHITFRNKPGSTCRLTEFIK